MRHRFTDECPEMDPTYPGYWSTPRTSVVWGAPRRITWAHPPLVEQHVRLMGRAIVGTMTALATTWLTRLPIAALISASRYCPSCGDALVRAAARDEPEGRRLVVTP